MRQIGNTNNNDQATIESQNASGPFEPASDNSLAVDLVNPNATPAIVEADPSSVASSLLSASNTGDTSDGLSGGGPLLDTDVDSGGTATSLLASLNGNNNGGGSSDQGSMGGSQPTSGIASPLKNDVASVVHSSDNNSADATDAAPVATVASNLHGPLNSYLSDLGGGQSDHAINNTSAPIFIGAADNAAGQSDIAGGDSHTGGATETTTTSNSSSFSQLGGGPSDHAINNASAPIIIGAADNAAGQSNIPDGTPFLFGGDSHTGGTTQTTTTSTSGGSSTVISGTQSSGLIINVTYDASCASAPSGFTADVAAAIQYFESHFSNPITLNIDVGYGECAGTTLGSSTLGETNYNYTGPYTYSQVKNALVANATTGNDTTAIATLPSTDPTNGGTFYLSTAESKALGLMSGSSLDGYVGFSSVANMFDYNNSDGVNAGQYDFMGTLMHEISEVLGRVTYDGQNFTGAPDFSPLDLFHYSAPGAFDFSGTTPGYFSINGGQTNLNNFNTNTGGDFGDWASSAGNDAAIAFGVPGVVMPFSTSDLTALDVVGWKLSSSGQTAPTIASFSPDTGVVGDGITNSKILTLAGAATAGSTVNVYDGATLLGTATTNSSGAWSFTTATLTDGTHSFTATDTISGATSSASAALHVTVDTAAPDAPVISSDTILNNQVMVSGTALDQGVGEAGDVVKIYDGVTLLGTTTTNASGTWSYTSAPLSYGSHVLTATVTDVAGNTSALSQGFDPTVLPPAPTVSAFSPDTGVVGDGTTNANMLTLTGATAAAGSAVNVYDGAALLGTATANSSGAWSFTTASLADGTHSFTATDTVSGATSSASAALHVTVDTVSPDAPVISGDTMLNTNQVIVSGTALDHGVAEVGDIVKIYDGSTLLGTTTTDASGAWSYTTTALSSGIHSFTASDTDVAGNTSVASTALSVTLNTPAPAAPTVVIVDTIAPTDAFTSDARNSNGSFTLKGTALDNGATAAGDTINIYDGATYLGSTTVGSNGQWSFTSAPLSNTVHTFSSTATDAAGNVGNGTGSVIYGTTGNDTLASPTGHDIMTGGGGLDTFVFAASKFGNDVITDFQTQSAHHDIIQFSQTAFNSFAAVLAHAAQVGSNVVITADANDTITLNNVQLNKLTSADFHFV